MIELTPEQIAENEAAKAKREVSMDRMYIIANKALAMPAGKMGAQCGHAVLGLVMECNTGDPWRKLREYYHDSQTKIVLEVPDEASLIRAYEDAKEAGLTSVIIRDSGWTMFNNVPTLTTVGIGPCKREELPEFIRNLRTYKDTE